MKPADPALDYRMLVARGYDSCAQEFNAARAGSDEDLLAELGGRLTAGARILDLGCGGLPVSRSLAPQHTIVGVDISLDGRVRRVSIVHGAAEPGEILASDIVRGLARTSAGVAFEDRGEHTLKGIEEL